MANSATEVARMFSVEGDASNAGGDVFPGYPGMVVAGGTLQSMAWGFPLVMKSKKTGKPLKPKPVNNARTDKLDSFFWRHSFEEHRCLIPLSAWAEAEGPRGSMTRTWQRVAGEEVFAVAGIWRDSDEWGRCYSMVMTDAEGPSKSVHNRMPVILRPETYKTWQSASADEARALCVAYDGDLEINRTDEPWFRRN